MDIDSKILRNVSLKSFNTLGLDAKAEYFITIKDVETLIQALEWAEKKHLRTTVIGCGSNIVLTDNIPGLVLHMKIERDIKIISQKHSEVLLEIAAGILWDDFVKWSVENSLGGVENLSLIYGTVGAAPVQNIGAYDAEFKDVCEEVDAIEIKTRTLKTFTKEECEFSYRDSIFKREPNTWIIVSVRIKLDKNSPFNINYKCLKNNLPDKIENLTYKDIRNLVINIRNKKIPNPSYIGNAGSFFKNPIVNTDLANEIKLKNKDLVSYPIDGNRVKISAGWLIERVGYKGYKKGDVGMYSNQALVLVNYGKGTGEDVMNLVKDIRNDVKQKFGVDLEIEPVLFP